MDDFSWVVWRLVHRRLKFPDGVRGSRALGSSRLVILRCPPSRTHSTHSRLWHRLASHPSLSCSHIPRYDKIPHITAVLQTRHFINISVRSFVDKVFEHHLSTWMTSSYPSPARSTPLPTDATFMKKFNSSTGDPDPLVQQKLAKTMQLNFRSGIGELIWAMTTCRPDLAFSSVKLSQSNTCPHKIHFHGLKHALKFLYNSKDDGLCFWRTKPRMELPEGPIPPINSNRQDILLDDHPQFDASTIHAYADSDWATCVKT